MTGRIKARGQTHILGFLENRPHKCRLQKRFSTGKSDASVIWAQEMLVFLEDSDNVLVAHGNFWTFEWINDALRFWVGAEFASLAASL